jgi:hypothetical protein
VVEDLDGRPLEHRCDAMRDLSEPHDACHGNVVGRDAATEQRPVRARRDAHRVAVL